MKVLLVRAVQYQQAALLSKPTRDGHQLNVSQGSYFEVVTWGWTTGAKYRTRKFMTLDLVFSYLNKLNIGKYLSDDDYSNAWSLALPFQKDLDGATKISKLLLEKEKGGWGKSV